MNDQRPHPFAALAALAQKAEFPLALTGFAAILMKLFHLPAASLLLILTFSLLAMIYFFSIVTSTGAEAGNQQDKMVLKVNSMGCSIGVIGILFLLQRWPGNKLMILVSSGALIASLLYMIMAKRKEEGSGLFSSRLIYRTVSISVLEILLFLVSQGQVNH